MKRCVVRLPLKHKTDQQKIYHLRRSMRLYSHTREGDRRSLYSIQPARKPSQSTNPPHLLLGRTTIGTGPVKVLLYAHTYTKTRCANSSIPSSPFLNVHRLNYVCDETLPQQAAQKTKEKRNQKKKRHQILAFITAGSERKHLPTNLTCKKACNGAGPTTITPRAPCSA